jgi:hypothetical protein
LTIAIIHRRADCEGSAAAALPACVDNLSDRRRAD